MKKAVLCSCIVGCVIALTSALRILAIEVTVPSELWLDKMRFFEGKRVSSFRSLLSFEVLEPWVEDKSFAPNKYEACFKKKSAATSIGDEKLLNEARHECISILQQALRISPTDGRLWLELARDLIELKGTTPEVFQALRMSYKAAPREGWIAKPRQELAVQIWSQLPAQVRELALNSDLDAGQLLAMGDLLLSRGKPEENEHAVSLLLTSAEKGNPYALQRLGELYLAGKAIPADHQKAQSFLQRAIEKGSTGAQVRLGEALIRGDVLPKDVSRGLQLLETAAKTDQWGQYALGRLLLSGEIARNVPKALAMLEKSAKHGNAYALERLGEAYLEGDGVAVDSARAQAYFEEAVEKGSMGAQVKLGEALIKGDTLPKDIARGLQLLEEAAKTNEWGQLVLGDVLLSGTIDKDVPKAVTLLEAAAKQNNRMALERLAEIYRNGEGVQSDPIKAKEYDRRAAAIKSGNL